MTTKAESIYLQLKEDIINLKFSVSEVINEQTLATRYNVSKTPVREALMSLVQEGYLVKYPRRGYFIKEINYREYYELMQYRFMLEMGLAHYIIAKCADEQIKSLFEYTAKISVTYDNFNIENEKFHMAVAKLTGNRYMEKALNTVFKMNVRQTAMEGYNYMKDDMHKNHRKIVEALLTRNVQNVHNLLVQEIKRSDDNINLV